MKKLLIVLFSFILALAIPLITVLIIYGKTDITVGTADISGYEYTLEGIRLNSQPYINISTKKGEATIYPFLYGITTADNGNGLVLIAGGIDLLSLGPYQLRKDAVRDTNVGVVDIQTYELQEGKDYSYYFDYILIKCKYGEQVFSSIQDFENSEMYKKIDEESANRFSRLQYGYDGGNLTIEMHYRLTKNCQEYMQITFNPAIYYESAYGLQYNYNNKVTFSLNEANTTVDICVPIVVKIDDMIWQNHNYSAAERVYGEKYVFAK